MESVSRTLEPTEQGIAALAAEAKNALEMCTSETDPQRKGAWLNLYQQLTGVHILSL